MNTTRVSNENAIRLTASHEVAASAVASAHRFAVRLLARVLHRHLKMRAMHDLRAVPTRYRADIGVAPDGIEEVADKLASRRVAAWIRRRLAPKPSRLSA